MQGRPTVLIRRCYAPLALVWDMHSAAYCQLNGIMRGRHAFSADTLVPCVSCIGMRHALSSFRPLDRVMQGRHASSADTPAPCISCIGMRHAFSSLLSPWWSNAREACSCACAPVTDKFQSQWASNAKKVSIYGDVTMWPLSPVESTRRGNWNGRGWGSPSSDNNLRTNTISTATLNYGEPMGLGCINFR